MSLKQVYESYFKIGTSVSWRNIMSERAKGELQKHYNSITAENAMKPMFYLDAEENKANPEKYKLEPALKFDTYRTILDFAKENNLSVRGHVLVWHSQTPLWFFKENYENEMEAPWASKETMLARMEYVIKHVLGFVQTEYPGLIYAWDVVNEAIEERENECWRKKSGWYQTLGEEFVLHAFRFARKYAAEGVALFYNDYNTSLPFKREFICEHILKPLVAEGLIDGMGMQTHLVLGGHCLKEYEKALHCYGSFGLKINITELDIHVTDPSEEGMEKLAGAYGELFRILVNAKKKGLANVTSVTFWGMKDDESWLTGFRKEKSYPLLFDDNYGEKAAYYAVIKVAEEV
jgi:GH35 family endo-1,4-beta-xylanase